MTSNKMRFEIPFECFEIWGQVEERQERDWKVTLEIEKNGYSAKTELIYQRDLAGMWFLYCAEPVHPNIDGDRIAGLMNNVCGVPYHSYISHNLQQRDVVSWEQPTKQDINMVELAVIGKAMIDLFQIRKFRNND